jgi:hypothetical protein
MRKPASRLELYLLGSPRVERAGAPVEADTRKAIALLAYLAVTGENQSREGLAALFWPDADEFRAHAALRRTLSVLNKALGGSGLNIDREAVSLARGTAHAPVLPQNLYDLFNGQCMPHVMVPPDHRLRCEYRKESE